MADSPAATVGIAWLGYIGSDWLAVYRDGKKVYEGHPPMLDDALDYLGIECVTAVADASVLSDQARGRGLPDEWVPDDDD